jgi:NADPH:quinone reductase-like Zn-dependent oxidoreductase
MHRFRDRDPSGEVGFSHFVQVFRREVGASRASIVAAEVSSSSTPNPTPKPHHRRRHHRHHRPEPMNWHRCLGLCDDGKLKTEVATVLPLAEVKKAHQLSESGRTRGKIVLRVGA